MMNRFHRMIPAVLLFLSLRAAALGQDDSPADVFLDLNEGILYYLQGQIDEASLDLAIERLSSVLQRQPDNAQALLFRALSHGRLGLVERRNKKRQQDLAAIFKEIRNIRADPERLDQIERNIQEAETVLADDSADRADKRVAQSMLDYHQVLQRQLEQTKESSDQDLESRREKALAGAHVHAGLKRKHYLDMIADLKRLTTTLEHPEAVVRLLEVVAQAKMARLNEEEARAVTQGDLHPSEAGEPVDALRHDATTRLNEAAVILEMLLEEELDKATLIRAKFFLGVIRYRQGIPLSGESRVRELDARGQRMLREASQLMAELADDETTDAAWRSYAALYLGIILPFRAVAEADLQTRDLLLDEAQGRLDQAAEIDARISDVAPTAVRSTIPDLVWRHRKLIADLRRKAGPTPPPRNDLSLSLYAGVRGDTNVVLLGERTDLPRGISDPEDFGFSAGGAIEYTWDFAEGLTLGFQGRVAELWNADIHEFDQQTYGASVAIQYEVAPEGDVAGPVYLALQYDFDYTLLGRDDFLESHAVTPSLRALWAGRRAQADLFVSYQLRDYFEPLYDRRFDRDGNYFTIGVLHQYQAIEMTTLYEAWGYQPWGFPGDDALAQDDPNYPNRYLTTYIGLSYAWDATVGDEFDRKAAALWAGVGLPLPWGLQLDASARFDWEDYTQPSLIDFHRRTRRDFVQEYGLSLSRTFVLSAGEYLNRYTPTMDRTLLTVSAFASWTEDDSNVVDRLGQAIFSYERTVFGLNFAFVFN